MLFLICFIAGGLVIPLMFDIQKHGKDNIFRRSGRDFLSYEPIEASLKFFHVSVQRVNTAVVGTASIVSIVAIVYVGVLLLEVVQKIINFFK